VVHLVPHRSRQVVDLEVDQVASGQVSSHRRLLLLRPAFAREVSPGLHSLGVVPLKVVADSSLETYLAFVAHRLVAASFAGLEEFPFAVSSCPFVGLPFPC